MAKLERIVLSLVLTLTLPASVLIGSANVGARIPSRVVLDVRDLVAGFPVWSIERPQVLVPAVSTDDWSKEKKMNGEVRCHQTNVHVSEFSSFT